MRVPILFSATAFFLSLAACGSGGQGGGSQAGGVSSVGGQHASGGAGGGAGGATSSGTSSGGSTGSGGTSTGGNTASGGAGATGGSTTGGSATGGSTTGGTTGLGGTTGSGGQSGTGGVSATGGNDAGSDVLAESGDSATGGGWDVTEVAPKVCTEADNKTVTSGSGEHCGYTYENWVNAGSATMTLKPEGFAVTWTDKTQFVAREGYRPGSGTMVVNYSADFQPNGNSYLCLYGWTTEPLAEYYVVDGWGSWRPPGGTSLGTVTSDGGTYDIYKMIRTNEPSIQGTATFPQYWSVRQQKITSGTITLANHISAWASKGMNMGTFYELSMTVEGYISSGTADVKFSIK
jgi:endo-1,4-beta-xylanase